MKRSRYFRKTPLAYGVAAMFAFGLVIAAGNVRAQDGDLEDGIANKRLGGILDLGRPHYSPVRTPAHQDIGPKGVGYNFRLVDHNPLIQTGGTLPRGGGGNDVNIIRNCAYAATKDNNQGLMILDISDPRNIEVVREMPPINPGADVTTDHIPTIESENLFLQTSEQSDPPWDQNFVELWDTSGDCFNPVKASTITLPDTPHDLKSIWQGGNPHKVLLIESFNHRRGEAFPPPPADVDLRIYDITDKYNPVGPIAEYSLQQVYGIPVREEPDLLTNGGFAQTNAFHDVNASNDYLSEEGFPTRLLVAALSYGWFLLDTTPLAEMLAGGATCDVEATGANPCVKKLHPDPEVRLEHDPPFSHSNAHTFQKLPGRPYALASDEPGPCPWGWLRFVYVGDEENGVEVENEDAHGNPIAGFLRGDLYPSIAGTFRLPENRVEDCEANMEKFAQDNSGDESFNPHLHLIFKNIMFTSWNNGGLRAIDISDPGMPFELGAYFPPPVGATAAGDIVPDLSLNNPPTLKDGLLYIMDRVNGVYVFEYTGPRRDEIPTSGLYTGEQNQRPFREP